MRFPVVLIRLIRLLQSRFPSRCTAVSFAKVIWNSLDFAGCWNLVPVLKIISVCWIFGCFHLGVQRSVCDLSFSMELTSNVLDLVSNSNSACEVVTTCHKSQFSGVSILPNFEVSISVKSSGNWLSLLRSQTDRCTPRWKPWVGSSFGAW